MKCTITQATYPSSNGINIITYYICYKESITPKGVIQLSHGMCEYFLRYDHFINYLTDHGFIICGNDHLGHGSSISKYDDLGYFAPKNGWHYLVEDVHKLTILMRRQFPNLPFVLMGHSMGSFIVRMYLDLYSSDIDGVILSGTGDIPRSLTSGGIAIATALKQIRGERFRSDFVKKLTGLDNKRYKDHYSELDWLTHDHKIIDEYAKDKKCNFVFTLSGYIDLFSLINHTSSPDWGIRIRKALPIYLFSGDEDPVGDFGKGVKRVYHHLQKVGIQDVSLRLYREGRHEMINELNRDEVYHHILTWINHKICSKSNV